MHVAQRQTVAEGSPRVSSAKEPATPTQPGASFPIHIKVSRRPAEATWQILIRT